jgi:hypothetical protein
VNPLLRVVQRAKLEAEQRRVMERALAESEPMDRVKAAPASLGDRPRFRGTPIMTEGVGGMMPGTDSLRPLSAQAPRTARRRPGSLTSGGIAPISPIALVSAQFVSRRTWIELTVGVAVRWVLAEVQNSDGWRGTLFDVMWVASLVCFVLLVVFGVIGWIFTRRSGAA